MTDEQVILFVICVGISTLILGISGIIVANIKYNKEKKFWEEQERSRQNETDN